MEIINSLHNSTKCPNCQGTYTKDDIRVLAEADNICFVQLDCHNCMSPLIATVFVNSGSDLTNISSNKDDSYLFKYYSSDSSARIHEYSQFGPISGDDILNIYSLIKAS